MAKKYRIIDSFNYKGKDGKQKDSTKWVRLSPGEEVPELSTEERQNLLMQERICEVDSFGENVRYKKISHLSNEDVESLMNQDPRKIVRAVETMNLSKETLEKVSSYAERKKMPKEVRDRIENKLLS